MKNRSITYLLLFSICSMLLVLQSCQETDDLRSRVDSLQERVKKLEEATLNLNTSVESLQALMSGQVIVGVTEITNSEGVNNGYKVELSNGETITVRGGKDIDLLIPQMSIDKDGYWIYSIGNGEFKRLQYGGKDILAIPHNEEGTTIKSPKLRVENKYWQISYDGGNTYDYLMDGDSKILADYGVGGTSVFKSVNYNQATKMLEMVLADDISLNIPVTNTFYLKVLGTETEQVFPIGEIRIYEVEQNDVEEAIIQAPKGWDVTLDEENHLTIKAPSENASGVEIQDVINIIITSSKNYIRVVPVKIKLLTTGYDSGTSSTWKDYMQDNENNVLLDFSYAGYKHGEVSPPDAYSLGYKIYNMKDYGAKGDGKTSDRAALLQIINEIGTGKANANAIIYFPKGEYVLHTADDNVDGKSKSISLAMGNVILKGAGRDQTIIKMAAPNEPAQPDQMWSAPVMMEIKNNSGLSDLTDVTGDAAKGTFSVEVASTTGIKSGDWVCLSVVNNDPEMVAQELRPRSATPDMTNLTGTGVQVYDYHQVKSISGSTITFVEPIMHAVEAKWGWKIKKYPHYENVGVEDLTFEGCAKPDFSHHASAADDGAYKLINLVRLTNSWMRRVAFVSVSEASSITNCANVSVYDVEIRGNRGHSAIRSQSSSRVFIGKVLDESNGYEAITSSGEIGNEMINGAGQYHACGVSKQSIGTVIWNVHWGLDACFESHATQPRATLIDRCEGGFMPWREGGDREQLPNHLDDLVIWNMKATKVKYDNAWGNKFIWWDSANTWWKNLPPVIVGFHGTSITFDDSPEQIKRLESNGAAVEPYSLYQAQLRARLGYVPAWLNSLQ